MVYDSASSKELLFESHDDRHYTPSSAGYEFGRSLYTLGSKILTLVSRISTSVVYARAGIDLTLFQIWSIKYTVGLCHFCAFLDPNYRWVNLAAILNWGKR